ncbi:DUF5776 domain-containing protein [Lactiplantibacillus paraplantarum]|uniref:DUF5776 domain-containing protein n=1 Tax=Lactiplantibacillus paraplantarum TaxID=60520 RepID=UPI002072F3F8|nr:DUF5776 domain-containing protein [Lactiplantibacillus paraplantarum]
MRKGIICGVVCLGLMGAWLTATSNINVSASTTDVTVNKVDLSGYYTTTTGKTAALIDLHVYSDVNMTKRTGTIAAGTLIKVLGIEYSSNGYPRFKTASGYVTTGRTAVVEPTVKIANYYTTNTGQIVALIDLHVFSDVNMTKRIGTIPAGTLVKVQKIEYSSDGFPRYKTSDGYITTGKTAVTFDVSTTNAAKIQQIIKLAKTKLGDPYTQSQAGRLGPNSFDCSGFVYCLYKTAAGVTLNGTVTTTEEKSGYEVSLNSLKPGDLLFYGTRGSTYHVGLYEGNGVMIHASTPEDGVKETQIQYYMPSFARRILD